MWHINIIEKLSDINRENMKILSKLVEISKGKLSTYGKRKQPRANSLMTTHHSITTSPTNITMSTTLSNNAETTLNYVARKRECERIDFENLKIKKYIDASKPVLSFGQTE